MTLDRQRARELAQALLRASSMRDANDFLINTSQSSMAPGVGIYGEVPFRGTGFPFPLSRTTKGGADASRLALNDAPNTSSRQATLQTTFGPPLAAAVGMGLQGIDQTYCLRNDKPLTFPPLIYQDKAPLTEAEKDECHKQNDHDWEQCKNNYSYSREALQRCRERADIIRDLCLRGETETLPWSDEDEDGIKLPRPPKGRKRK